MSLESSRILLAGLMLVFSALTPASQPSSTSSSAVALEHEVGPPLATLDAIYAKGQRELQACLGAGEPSEGANAIPQLLKAGKALAAVSDEQTRAGNKLDFRCLADPTSSQNERDVARKCLVQLEAQGIGDEIAAIAAAPRAAPTIKRELLFVMRMPQLQELRKLAHLNVGRAALAMERGDSEAFIARVDEILALSRHGFRQPFILGSLVGIAIRADALTSVRRATLTGTLDDKSLRILEEHVSVTPSIGVSRGIASEAIEMDNLVEFLYFAGPGALAEGASPPSPTKRVIAEGSPLEPGMPDRVTQLKLTKNYYDYAQRLAGLNAAQRNDNPEPPEFAIARKSNRIFALLETSLSKTLMAQDQMAADDSATRTLIALERYQLSHHAYPESLKALVPEFLHGVLTDPFTGKSLGYLPPKPNGYDGGRSFVLYAAGRDAEDNGGKVNFESPFDSLRDEGKGMDFLLNRETK